MRAPSFTLPLLLLVAGCIDADLRRGDHALGHGQYGQAIAFYEAARSRLPPPEFPAQRLASAYRARAMSWIAEGLCEDAGEHFEAAEALTPPVLADRQALYACAASRGADPTILVEHLETLLKLGDTRAEVLRTLMHLELELKREHDAAGRLDALEKRYALTQDDRRRLVPVLLRLGREPDAYRQVATVVRQDPVDPLMRLKLAELLEGRGEHYAAEAAYRALGRDFSRNPLVHLRLSDFLARRGRAEESALIRAQANALQRLKLPPRRRDLRPLRKSRR